MQIQDFNEDTMEKKLDASVKNVLKLVAEQGLDGSAEIRCLIKGHSIDEKATLKLGTHSHPNSYHTFVHHLEIEFDEEYIDRIVRDRVAKIFAKLAAEACAKPTT